MRKYYRVLVVVLMMVLALSLGVANAKETAKEKADRDAAITKVIATYDNGLPKVVDEFFSDLDKSATANGYGFASVKIADAMISTKIAQMAEKGGIENAMAAFMEYALFEMHINDEISCAVTVEEAKELKDAKDVAYMAGGAWATNVLRKTIDVQDNSGNDTTSLKRYQKVIKHILDSTPHIRQLYMKNPNRKHCER